MRERRLGVTALGWLAVVVSSGLLEVAGKSSYLSKGLPQGFRLQAEDYLPESDRRPLRPLGVEKGEQPRWRGGGGEELAGPKNRLTKGGQQGVEEEEEVEEIDKLSLLLPKSRFSCEGRKTGYYADEELGCEVFHYCHDSARHSWICPDSFLFHQVHLICMPGTSDNICSQSSQYHFVNDFLYRPLNAEEALARPNVTLRYSDRYYPENVEQDQQVFHSPEEVNIPLQQRRPGHQHQSGAYRDQSNEDFQYKN